METEQTKRFASFLQSAERYAEECSAPAQPSTKEKLERGTKLFDAARCPKKQASRTELTGKPWHDTLALLKSELGHGGIFALIGANGPGKTQLGVECIRYRTCEKLKSALYAAAMEFFLDLKASYRPGSEKDERAVITDYAKPNLLVLDECQERGETAWEDRMLTYLLDRRYREERDTILISNLKREEFEISLGRSVIDRLNETGGIIECTWESYRR